MQHQETLPRTHETITPWANSTPVESLIIVYGLDLAFPLALMLVGLVLWVRARLRAKAWRAPRRPGEPLAEGNTVLQGTVEHALGSKVAVRVDITQEGTEKIVKRKWRHIWKEVGREVTANPFYVAETSGARVRVEPENNVVLIDTVDQTTALDKNRRVRSAELTAGEQVSAMGRLERAPDPEAPQGYRDNSAALVLRPSKNGPMILASEQQHARFERTARNHLIGLAVLGICVAIFQLVALPYHFRNWLGETVWAEVIHKEKYSVSGPKGGRSTKHIVSYHVGAGEYEETLVPDQYGSVAVGDSVPLRRVSRWPSNQQLGAAASISSAYALVSIFVVPFFALPYVLLALRRRPWWDKPLNEVGSGPLGG